MLFDEWPVGMAAEWPHFDETEMQCKCGCLQLPDPLLMRMLEQLRVGLDFALPVSSGARCPRHNDAVSSSGLNGPHTTGLAVDISINRGQALKLVAYALVDDRWTGYGINQKGGSRFIHLDLIPPGGHHPRPTIWSY
jgi:uncharacterized protein YcbK (DUF882 family)